MKAIRQVLLGVLCLLGSVAVPAEESVSEARLKAGFIANFLEFVSWPKTPAPLYLCSFGSDRLGELLENLADTSRRGATLAIRRVRAVSELNGCHAVYVPAEHGSVLSAVVAATAGRPVLIMSDLDGGAPLGAMLSIVTAGGGRLGFDANLTAARAAGLAMNSRLLQLARRVY
ncbi:MAG: YfiR family protein [Sulfuritalea sp.]|nr:YfiR family protein [Sulfuritalea sp.]